MSDLPAAMRCIDLPRFGGPEVLTPAERPIPRPAAGEILIKVEAAGVNRPDVLQRSGNYPLPPGASDLPGLEAAGRVAAVGAGVARWTEGDAVTALLPGGGYAEYVTTPAEHALPVPDGFSMVEAAAVPETLFTCWINMVDRGDLTAGETFLVHGGSSGIGSTAIQLAVALGARAFATVGSAEKAAFCRGLGAEAAFNYREQDFVEEIKAATGGRGADLILDMVAGDYIPRDLCAGRRWAAGDHRLSARPAGQGQLRAADDPPPDRHRIDAAAAIRRLQGAHGRAAGGGGLAPAGRPPHRAGDPCAVPAA